MGTTSETLDAAVLETYRIDEAIRSGGINDVLTAYDGLARALDLAVKDGSVSEYFRDISLTMNYVAAVKGLSSNPYDAPAARSVVEQLGAERYPAGLADAHPILNQFAEDILGQDQ